LSERKIKAVLFDLGETLLTFGRVDTLGFFRQGARLAYDFIAGRGRRLGGFELYYWRSLISLRLHHLLSRITGRDFEALGLLKKAAAKKGIELSQSDWENVVWLWYAPLSKVGCAEPDITQTLDGLKEAGLKLGIVSNTFINGCVLDRHLKQVGISDLFDFRLYSYEVDFRKPDRRIFEAAAERLGHKLENIMFVGDRIDNDIKPALRLGMTAVLKDAYTNKGKKVPQGAWKVNLLSELPGLIERIEAE